jgi:uncharacterized protein YjbJ (UPF0337 family)
MNKDTVQGSWRQLKGKVKEKWGQLTDDELDEFEGQTEQLAGFIQKRTGEARDSVQRQLDEWQSQA